mmetsp:Transcript_72904/g.116286  ORF Transcript_72904/g.116286 Transcript_72904/m.116286 type:complete len:245 (-) Transcript_72904:56-790(-)
MSTPCDAFVWSKRQELTIAGYVRQNSNMHEKCPLDVVRLIDDFCALRVTSTILSRTENEWLVSLLCQQFMEQQLINERKDVFVNHIQLSLLYRASENAFSAASFHEQCDYKGSTISVIHNEFDHVFGGFVSVSWGKTEQHDLLFSSIADPNSFMYQIRPQPKLCALKAEHKYSARMIQSSNRFGPVMGCHPQKGHDFCIFDKCDTSESLGFASSYQGTSNERYGDEMWLVKDYEVFSVVLPASL